MTMLDVFMESVKDAYSITNLNSITPIDGSQKVKLLEDAHESWLKMYSQNTAITPLEAKELGIIYEKLYFSEQRYLKLNKEFSKYTAK